MRSAARFPTATIADAHYESFYLKLCDPAGGRGLWVRYTVHKRPGNSATGSLWFTWFQRGQRPRATKLTVSAEQITVPVDTYIEIAGARLTPGTASGSIETEALRCAWDLRFIDRHDAFHHLPQDWMYRAKLPRTKLLSPHPGARFEGSVTIAGERIEITDWPGMVGHNWGSEHAERWTWIHAAGFANRPADEYLDIGAGRIKLGPLTTPWIGNGVVAVDGAEHRLGGPARIRSTRFAETPTGCEFVLPGGSASLRGTISAPAEEFVGWIYADPDGAEHNTVNCSIATIELVLERPGEPDLELRSDGGATYELGMREREHPIAIEPYPDG